MVKKKKWVLLLAFFVTINNTFAQKTGTVRGVVSLTSTKIPVAGVAVSLVGTSKTAFTDANGKYSIEITDLEKDQLLFLYNQKQLEIVSISGRTIIDIDLPERLVSLPEIAVVYQTQQQKYFSGAAHIIIEKEINQIQANDLTKLLFMSTGVSVFENSGQPGAVSEVRLRGITSLDQSSNLNPLYIIDGQPINIERNNNLSNNPNPNNLAFLNAISPSDIASITVLKDAAATALYGSRAANGVILINTKTPVDGAKTQFNYSFKYGIADFAVQQHAAVNAAQYMLLTWQALKNAAQANPALLGKYTSAEEYASYELIKKIGGEQYNPFSDPIPVDLDGKLKPNMQQYWDQDWQKILQRPKAIRGEHNFSLRGANEKSNYMFSGNYLSNQGKLIGSDFERYTASFKMNTVVNKAIEVGLNTNLAFSQANAPMSNSQLVSDIIAWQRETPNIYPAFVYETQPNGDKTPTDQYDFSTQRPYKSGANSLGTTLLDKRYEENIVGMFNPQIIIHLQENIQLKTNLSWSRNDYHYTYIANPFFGDGASSKGIIREMKRNTDVYNFNHNLNWKKKINQHYFDVLLGTEWFKTTSDYVLASKKGFVFPEITAINTGTMLNEAQSAKKSRALGGYYAQLNYNLKEKYNLNLSFRREASSRFQEKNRWGDFGAIGASWLIDQEDFFKGITWINALKIRTSYGLTGNEALNDYYPYENAYNLSAPNLDNFGGLIEQLGNEKISWEKNHQLNFGFDAQLWQKLFLVFDHYYRLTQGALMRVPIPNSVGINSYIDNVGSFLNTGVELGLKGLLLEHKNYTLVVHANTSWNKNKVLSLPQERIILASPLYGSQFQLKEGGSMYDFYLPEFAGVDVQTGLPLWYQDKIQADGSIVKQTTGNYSEATVYNQGSMLPKLTGVFGTEMKLFDFDISLLFAYKWGGKIYDAAYASLLNTSRTGNTQLSPDVFSAWQQAGEVSNIAALTTQAHNFSQPSTRFLVDGSFIRLRNISIGYTVPKKWINRWKIDFVRVYVQGENLWTWFGKKGLDPEQSIYGVNKYNYPTLKTYSVGLSTGF